MMEEIVKKIQKQFTELLSHINMHENFDLNWKTIEFEFATRPNGMCARIKKRKRKKISLDRKVFSFSQSYHINPGERGRRRGRRKGERGERERKRGVMNDFVFNRR